MIWRPLSGDVVRGVATKWSDVAPEPGLFIAETALKEKNGPFPGWPTATGLAAAGNPDLVRRFAEVSGMRVRDAGYAGIWGDPAGMLSDAPVPWLGAAVASAAVIGFRRVGLRVAQFAAAADGWWIDEKRGFVPRTELFEPLPARPPLPSAGKTLETLLATIEADAITLVDDPGQLPLAPDAVLYIYDPGQCGAAAGLRSTFAVVGEENREAATAEVWVDACPPAPRTGDTVVAVACRRLGFLAGVLPAAVKVAVYSDRKETFSALAQKLIGAEPWKGRLPVEVASTDSPAPHAAHFSTEHPHPHFALRWLENQDVARAASAILAEETRALAALQSVVPKLAEVVDMVRDCWARGGRLFYLGAGSAGRAGTMDAAEQPPTFGVAPEMAQAILAGGPDAVHRAQEGAEDDEGQGAEDVERYAVGQGDVLLAITAHGNTPYVLGAARRAGERGAVVVGIVNNRGSQLAAMVEQVIEIPSGPEVLVGSTRLKAGTAEKVILNTISTLAMVGLGRTYDNLMVDFMATNLKLRERAVRVFMMATGLPRQVARDYLAQAGGELKTAIVAARVGCPVHAARDLLHEFGSVQKIIDAIAAGQHRP